MLTQTAFQIDDTDFQRVRKVVHNHCGISLSDEKRGLVQARITRQMRARLAVLGPVVLTTATGADFVVQGDVKVVPIPKGQERVEIHRADDRSALSRSSKGSCAMGTIGRTALAVTLAVCVKYRLSCALSAPPASAFTIAAVTGSTRSPETRMVDTGAPPSARARCRNMS